MININILCYFLFGIAGGQEVDHTFIKFNKLKCCMKPFSNKIQHSAMRPHFFL